MQQNNLAKNLANFGTRCSAAFHFFVEFKKVFQEQEKQQKQKQQISRSYDHASEASQSKTILT